MELEQISSRWSNHPFFAPDTVVLGLDIGIEGIGITVRKGRECNARRGNEKIAGKNSKLRRSVAGGMQGDC